MPHDQVNSNKIVAFPRWDNPQFEVVLRQRRSWGDRLPSEFFQSLPDKYKRTKGLAEAAVFRAACLGFQRFYQWHTALGGMEISQCPYWIAAQMLGITYGDLRHWDDLALEYDGSEWPAVFFLDLLADRLNQRHRRQSGKSARKASLKKETKVR